MESLAALAHKHTASVNINMKTQLARAVHTLPPLAFSGPHNALVDLSRTHTHARTHAHTHEHTHTHMHSPPTHSTV